MIQGSVGDFDVCICTHNPRQDLLGIVLRSIADQTVAAAQVVIVDNGSSPPLDASVLAPLIEKNVRARLIQEPTLGINQARLMAIASTTSDWVLFVDDDNELDKDYLQKGMQFIREHPEVGCVGGILRLPDRIRPDAWLVPFLPYLGIKNAGPDPIIEFSEAWGPWEPAGAGAFVHRKVLDAYAACTKGTAVARKLGRKGALDLSSCEDSLIMRLAISVGLANAYCPDLALTHHLAPHRLTFDYLLALFTAYGRSHMNLRSVLNEDAIFTPVYSSRQDLDTRAASMLESPGFPTRHKVALVAHEIAARNQQAEIVASFQRSALPITLVTACLNAGATIERTLKSIEAQNYPNLQYIICDGGSEDDTLSIIREYSHIVSRLHSAKDRGVAHALNKGFAEARGEIRCYLNADDCLKPHALDIVSAMFSNNLDVDVITGGCERYYADGSVVLTQVPDRFVDVIHLRNDFEQPSTFWRSAIHEKSGAFDESFRLAFDWEWWNRLHAHGARFKRTRQTLSAYYFSDTNLTSRGGAVVVDEMYRVTKAYAPHEGRIADVYRDIYREFDLEGFFDDDASMHSDAIRRVFQEKIAALKAEFGDTAIDSYNWNWASRQVRGLKWY